MSGTCCSEPSGEKPHNILVPADKNLPEPWLSSLQQRGQPEVYRGDALKHIGMPVGGICCGQVYLSGDGRLWHWDVFKAYGGTQEPIDPRGLHYASPIKFNQSVRQGFVLRVNGTLYTLDADGFDQVEFCGQYPLARVDYQREDLPLKVSLTAYSPFVPLDERRSGLPATVLEISLENRSDKPMKVDVLGWLENRICPYSNAPDVGLRTTTTRHDAQTSLTCSAQNNGDSDPSSLDGFGTMSLLLLDAHATDKSVPMGLVDQHENIEVDLEALFSGLADSHGKCVSWFRSDRVGRLKPRTCYSCGWPRRRLFRC